MTKKLFCILTLLIIALVASPGARAQLRLGSAAGESAKWSAKAEMTSKTGGVITITAEVGPKWHVYGLETPKDAPVATEIEIVGTGITLTGKLTASPAPKVEFDSAFGVNLPFWEEGKVTFTRPFKVTGKDPRVEIKIGYFACSGMRCNPKKSVDFTLTIPKYQKH